MDLYEMNPLERKTSKNSEAHPMSEKTASIEALESTALRYSVALDMAIWGIQGSLDERTHTGAALGTGRAVKTAQGPGESRRVGNKVWLLKSRNLRRTGRLPLDLSLCPQNTAWATGGDEVRDQEAPQPERDSPKGLQNESGEK